MNSKGMKIQQSLDARAERIMAAGRPGMTPMAEECRRPRAIVTVETYRTMQEAQAGKPAQKKPQEFKSWRKTKVNWSSITYTTAQFRETAIQFDEDKNLSRFVWRTAKLNGMQEITLSDVQKMLDKADETIWILKGDHAFMAEDPNKRAPTWVMRIDRKKMYAALMRITEAGWATTELRDIEVKGEKMQQRVWTLKEGATA